MTDSHDLTGHRLTVPAEVDGFIDQFSKDEIKDTRRKTLLFIEIAIAAVALHLFTKLLEVQEFPKVITYPLWGLSIFVFICDIISYFLYILISTAVSIRKMIVLARAHFKI